MTLIAMTANVIEMMALIKHKTILSRILSKGMSDGFGEKGEESKKLHENGMFGKFFLFLTSIYLSDKERFLLPIMYRA